MVITHRLKSLSLLLLFITNVVTAMESSQQRLTSFESPRQKKELPSVHEIKKMHTKRTIVSGVVNTMFTLSFLMSLYYLIIYPCEGKHSIASGGCTQEKRFERPIDHPGLRAAATFFVGVGLTAIAGAYHSKLDREYEARVFEPLKKAIKAEKIQDVQELVSADINMENYGLTPLRISLRENKPAIVRMLLERGAHPEHGDHSALFDCADHADRWTFELLLKNKANSNAVCGKSNCCGQTILNYVISGQHAHSEKAACVQLLIQHGADPRQKNPKDKKDSYQMNTSLEIAELLEANKG